MTPEEHHAAAERLVARAEDADHGSGVELCALALVHGLLAIDGRLSRGIGVWRVED